MLTKYLGPEVAGPMVYILVTSGYNALQCVPAPDQEKEPAVLVHSVVRAAVGSLAARPLSW